MAPPKDRYLGKYRGRVAANDDPLQIGRIQVNVPDVLGREASTWAMPCFPMTGPEAGVIAVPQVGAGVWVEFEQGDPSFPIWTGGWYGNRDEAPDDAVVRSPDHVIVLQTPGGHKIVLSDDPDTGIILRTPDNGPYLQVKKDGVFVGDKNGAAIKVKAGELEVGRLTVPRKKK
ncbi:phage baseplate assembly protein V [Streptomyces boninensis]|uniref:phage baseplate assembly protein V n=1 Tax=Streptomyces boninensis TaxID=2039455 RepID=UPI003B21254E